MDAAKDEAGSTAPELLAELEPGEGVAWTGRPSPVTLRMREIPLLLFTVGWLGTSGFFSLVALAAGNALGVVIAGMFVLFGLLIVWTLVDNLVAARRTWYAVTDRRVLVVRHGLRQRVTSWTPRQITSVERLDRSAGGGDIVFHQSFVSGGEASVLKTGEFLDVPDARSVQYIVLRLCDT